jgi:hypothetical protein
VKAGILLIALAACLTSAHAAAEPVVALAINGPVDNRINLVVLGDGYTQGELSKYASDTDRVLQAFFRQSPFVDYARYFNLYRVDVTSNESGVDHPESNVTRDTALGAAYNCSGIQRLICVTQSAVNNVLSRSVPANQRDLVLVIVNDPAYGGSGGAIAVTSTNESAVELILHETGHTLGLLADEYTDQPPACVNNIEPPEPNASREPSANVKWSYWVSSSTPLPTTTTTAATPGTYLGAKYCPEGLYRPTNNSKMRSLNQPFEQINSEQLVRRFYNFVAPIDAFSPGATSLSPAPNEVLTFSIVPPTPAASTLAIAWSLDGRTAAQTPSYTLSTTGMSVGTHTVDVEVADTTPLVRRDPNGALRQRIRWTITITTATLPNEIQDALRRWRLP